MIDDNVINNQDAARVGGRDHVLQVGQVAPVGRHLVEVPPRVAVKLPVAVEHNGRNPNRRRTQCLDVIELLLDPFEIPAVD